MSGSDTLEIVSIKPSLSQPLSVPGVAIPQNRLICMIVNGAIGDQYGAPIEMMPCEAILAKYGKTIDVYLETAKIAGKPYTYTDDTQMTISVIHLLTEHKIEDLSALTETQLMDHHIKYFEPSRGYSLSTYNIMLAYLIDKTIKIPDQNAHKTTNGGLMRVSPVVVRSLEIQSGDPSEDRELIMKMVHAVHYPTHLNQITVHTSYIFIKFLRFLYNIEDESEHRKSVYGLQSHIVEYIKDHLIPECKENEKLSEMLNIIVVSIGMDEYEVMDNNLIGLDGIECYETLSCGIWGLLNHLNTPDTILSHVITYGGDCDTIAGITGQMAGILFGSDAIRSTWFETLENKEMLINISTTLINKLAHK